MSFGDNDSYAYYGTPLKEIEEDEARSRKAPRVEDQIVTDKQGRRRFHGAFTGGFSAGYFNSVGTKDGWTPSSFVSSKSKRNEDTSSLQCAEDFMDDEDLDDHGIAPQKIKATSNFNDIKENRKRSWKQENEGPIPGQPVLEMFLQPSRDTMGVKLLKKFGWKPGQGIGPRVTKMEKKKSRQNNIRIYGCNLPKSVQGTIEESSDESDTDCISDITFAPDDVQFSYLSTAKADLFGLGYKPLERTNVLGGALLPESQPLRIAEKKKAFFQGHAFGVGAFEEEDEDIYAREDMSSYDFELGSSLATDKNSKDKSAKNILSITGLAEKLEGFEISSKPLERPKSHPLPSIPSNFVPYHVSKKKKRFEIKKSEVQGLGRHDLSLQDRKRMLEGGASVKIEVRSGLKPERESLDPDLLEMIKSSSSDCNSSEFKPFSKDPEKQKRYDLFLKMKDKEMKDRFVLVQPKTMTEWEKEREKMEFQRASELFSPLTSTMATRFVTAKTDNSAINLKAGLSDHSAVKQSKSSEEVDVLGGSLIDDRTKAARSKMFGIMTQTVSEWHPTNLLCKRFNVPNPRALSTWVDVSHSTAKNSSSIYELLRSSKSQHDDHQTSDSGQDDPGEKSPEEKYLGCSSPTPQAETYGLQDDLNGPPTMDLFKAIFQDSDSDENEKDVNDIIKKKVEAETPRRTPFEKRISRWEKPISEPETFKDVSRETFQNIAHESGSGSGIFGNLDFNLLNQYRFEHSTPQPIPPTKDASPPPYSESSSSENEYGPSLPKIEAAAPVAKHCNFLTMPRNMDSEEKIWMEKKSSSKKHKRKSKKDKKKKQKKEKKRRKSKKRRSRSSSSSRSSSD